MIREGCWYLMRRQGHGTNKEIRRTLLREETVMNTVAQEESQVISLCFDKLFS